MRCCEALFKFLGSLHVLHCGRLSALFVLRPRRWFVVPETDPSFLSSLSARLLRTEAFLRANLPKHSSSQSRPIQLTSSTATLPMHHATLPPLRLSPLISSQGEINKIYRDQNVDAFNDPSSFFPVEIQTKTSTGASERRSSHD